jgi:hypothetical protein
MAIDRRITVVEKKCAETDTRIEVGKSWVDSTYAKVGIILSAAAAFLALGIEIYWRIRGHP